MDYEAASELRGYEGWRRLVIDEPQDRVDPGKPLSGVVIGWCP